MSGSRQHASSTLRRPASSRVPYRVVVELARVLLLGLSMECIGGVCRDCETV